MVAMRLLMLLVGIISCAPIIEGGSNEASCTNPSGNRINFNDIDDLRQQILDAHNYYRCLHGVPSLTLDDILNTYAQSVANDNAVKGKLEHSDGQYGENIYASYGQRITGKLPTKSWYDEIQYYDFNNPGYSDETGHFTQVVWMDSKKLGCGYKQDSAQQWEYIACSYDPRSISGARNFKKNVPEPV
ncbi:Golgi-associated plant pathogenesis-related protein 1-like [Antedon mediterranea]|uniref:Golgi-associated plant pathogenesis-related protein 1-like n=1 Tax=Antedon mediterranea TaxID=105859 RepID=UPI003AF9D730